MSLTASLPPLATAAATYQTMDSSKRPRDDDPSSSDHQPPPKSLKQNPLQDIPTTHHYQVSYMHRSTVTHSCSSLRHGYVITGSVDGVVKFWKRTSTAVAPAPADVGGGGGNIGGGASKSKEGASSRCLEFVKSYSSHVGPILALATSQPNGDSAVSIGWDGVIKFYDVATFDVSGMIRTNGHAPTAVNGDGKKKYRLGRHAVLIEREDLYLLVSTRAPTREELQWELKEKERVKQLNDDDDDGPRPAGVADAKAGSALDNMVPSGSILMFSGINLSSDPLRVITYHATPVTALAYHPKKQWVISGDVSGVLEVWNVPFSTGDDVNGSSNAGSSQGMLPFQSKLDTDLYALIKKKTYAIDIAVSEVATKENVGMGNFAVYSSDRKVRLFSFKNCKFVCIYDERLKVYDKLLSSKSSAMGLDAIEYGNRAALEREMEDAHLLSGGVLTNPSTKQTITTVTPSSEGSNHQSLHLSFDNTGNYLLLPTIVGIKVINIQNHNVVATIGKGDASSLRFLHVCLCPGDAKVDQQLHLARTGGSSAAISHKSGEGGAPANDSLLIALAYGKRRFYAFSHHDPLDSKQGEVDEQVILARDILNEAPDASDLLEASHLGRSNNDPHGDNATLTTATHAVLRTTHGDISIKLFAKETPRTNQNFVGHAQSGYYDNVIFHRIIPGFMVQTGDPDGDGTGGQSIWGGEFEDEFVRDLRHDRPFTVSMANA